jgi:hypothetical protein
MDRQIERLIAIETDKTTRTATESQIPNGKLNPRSKTKIAPIAGKANDPGTTPRHHDFIHLAVAGPGQTKMATAVSTIMSATYAPRFT